MTSIKARPFDFPYDGRLDPARTALIAIDLQVDFLSSDGYFARKGYDPSTLRAIIPAVKRLAAGARAAGVQVVWTRQGFRADLADATDYDRWRARRSGIELRPSHDAPLVRGGPGFDIAPELEPQAGDIFIDKTANSAFYQTDLDMILRSRGVTHLLFAGCTTEVCVHSSLRDAVDRKYQCLLVEDACASGDADAHAAALHMVTVEDGIFGVLGDSDAVIAGLKAAAAPSDNSNQGKDHA
jgi:nicotinamidase-related amidase